MEQKLHVKDPSVCHHASTVESDCFFVVTNGSITVAPECPCVSGVCGRRGFRDVSKKIRDVHRDANTGGLSTMTLLVCTETNQKPHIILLR